MLNETQRQRFDLIRQAAKNGALCLLECDRKSDGKKVAVVCAHDQEKGEYFFVPLGTIADDDNPYEALIPPNNIGGSPVDQRWRHWLPRRS